MRVPDPFTRVPMIRALRLAALLTCIVVSACQPAVDITAATTTLLDTDRAWGRLASANASVDSIVDYWTSDARVILPGQPIVVGAEALRGMVASMQAIPGFRIEWTPDSAVVAPSGDVGFTFGTNRITAPDAQGVLRTTEGRYVTWWRLEADGRWRCSVDISNEGPSAVPTVAVP